MPTKMQEVLDAMRDGQSHRPTELIESLRKQGMTEAEAKGAIAYLLNDMQLEMTENRVLRLTELVA
jgi:hypothetical protein